MSLILFDFSEGIVSQLSALTCFSHNSYTYVFSINISWNRFIVQIDHGYN